MQIVPHATIKQIVIYFLKKKGSIYPHTIEKNTNIAFQFR